MEKLFNFFKRRNVTVNVNFKNMIGHVSVLKDQADIDQLKEDITEMIISVIKDAEKAIEQE